MFPKTVGSAVVSKNISADIGNTTLYTPAYNGLFRLSGYMTMTVADAGQDGVNFNLVYTDDYGAQTANALASLDTAAVPNNASFSQTFEAVGGSPIKYNAQTAGSTPYPTARYSLYLVLEQLA